MPCDQYDFIVVEYCRAFPEAVFRPCLVYARCVDKQAQRPAAEIYRSNRWQEWIDPVHQDYLESLIEDWTTADSEMIREQLKYIVIGPIRMGEQGTTDHAGLHALVQRILDAPAAN